MRCDRIVNMNNQNLGMGVGAEDPRIFGQKMAGAEAMQGNLGVRAAGNTGFETQQMVGEQQTGAMMGEAQRQINAGLENAVGTATVGALGIPQNVPQATKTMPAVAEAQTNENVLERVPEEAKDGEKVEKAWIERADEVVNETRDNPHKRCVQVALLREEYMRKRFNRILGEHN